MNTRQAAELYQAPNVLSQHYTHFGVAERLLLTGHSHQAWPDCARLGQQQAWDDAALHVDDKWQRAFLRAERVREGYARLLHANPDGICLGTNTHELLTRFLSALPLQERPRIVTTDAEFHSMRRQLARLEETGIEIVRVTADPAETVGERLARAVDDRTAAVLVSSVFYDSARIAGGLAETACSCERHGSELLIDAYHHLNVVPFALGSLGLEHAFIVGGGYKYCQLGEGNAFLRSPPDCQLRPVVTGWYAEFDALDGPPSSTRAAGVRYGSLRTRFAGATYDPTSHYRAAEVFDFFAEQQLTPALLREVSQHQIGVLRSELDALQVAPSLLSRADVTLPQLAGFLTLRSAHAARIQHELQIRGVHCDNRGELLRLGPAPYLHDGQLRDAIRALGEVVRLPLLNR